MINKQVRCSNVCLYLLVFLFSLERAMADKKLEKGEGLGERTTIGLVDLQRALENVESGKKAKAQMEKDMNAKRKELQSKEEEIKHLTKALQNQTLVINEKTRIDKQNEIQEKILKFQDLVAHSQSELSKKEQDLFKPIVLKFRSIIGHLAQTKGYSLVLRKDEVNVLYSEEQHDLTDKVIEVYNKQMKVD